MAISLDVIVPGTIGEYDDLVAMVGDWLDRDDLTDRIPEFVALLEARLNRLLRTNLQETAAVWAVTDEEYALPDDFRKLRRLNVAGSAQPLSEVASNDLPQWSSFGQARVYAVEGRYLRFSPAPSAENPLTLSAVYWRRIPPLGTGQPTNWLLNENPDIYVWGALHQAATYIRDPDAIDTCKAYLDEAIAELQQASRKDAWGGPLAPSPARQVRGARC
ncbi:phage adaptor protein [Sphingobium sp. EP60837]|uniref:phage adaptor protein n=1 Tax=Sphingobium sp. EP60837 TaxID=1855519 RepID=UPI0007DDABFA|nr:hypothetical protein [Sphingobium sp. EP60837]ANI79011.1 hypothetical protein EP837_02616 [Sphingobium sp. EP60837]